jgi:hypothetical protein
VSDVNEFLMPAKEAYRITKQINEQSFNLRTLKNKIAHEVGEAMGEGTEEICVSHYQFNDKDINAAISALIELDYRVYNSNGYISISWAHIGELHE